MLKSSQPNQKGTTSLKLGGSFENCGVGHIKLDPLVG